jgi:hypothetical protein
MYEVFLSMPDEPKALGRDEKACEEGQIVGPGRLHVPLLRSSDGGYIRLEYIKSAMRYA